MWVKQSSFSHLEIVYIYHIAEFHAIYLTPETIPAPHSLISVNWVFECFCRPSDRPHPGTFEKLVFRLTSCQSLCSMTCKVAAAARVLWAGDHIRHIPARRNCKDERSPPICQGLGGCVHWGESFRLSECH